jgi:Zn-dependent protease with chaperone function
MAEPAGRRTLDFFAAQSRARRNTLLLVPLFLLAWVGTIVIADLAVALALSTDPMFLALPVALLVTLVVLGGSAWHAVRLASGGGDAVAQMLGGRPVDRATTDPDERRLVNVVEEMGIAAGLPVPRLYVLDREEGINAFAAGFTPERSVVAVTRGALSRLDRDELQGVVAHELSHVLNSDTRLSTRLMAMVGGLTVLALLGRILLQAGSGRGRNRGGGLTIGLGLLVAGSVGAFFGRMIRAAVSRQREFLADAAAVQFTRNPGGLAGALRKIGADGSRLATPEAIEASHLFFAEGVGGFLSRVLATHPPLEERIRRITQGDEGRLAPPRIAPSPAQGAPASASSPDGTPTPLPASALAGVAASVGHPGPEHVARAGDLLAGLPPLLVETARQPHGARSLACALLLEPDPAVRRSQLAPVRPDEAAHREIARLLPALDGLGPEARIALLDLALPALDHLSPAQAAALAEDLGAIAARDPAPSVLDWAVLRLVQRRLAPLLGGRRAAPVRVRTLEEVQVECLELLSALAWAGDADGERAQRWLAAGLHTLGMPATWRLLPRGTVDGPRLDRALARLDEASPELKSRVLAACAACVVADGRVSPDEAEVVRAVAASLGCPVPPLEPAPLATTPA